MLNFTASAIDCETETGLIQLDIMHKIEYFLTLEVDEEVSLLIRGFQLPILAGWVPVRTPIFGIYLYGGLANRFMMNGRIYYKDEEYKFKPKDAKLHFYNLGFRLGTQIDLAMFNFDLSYTIGITNSFRDRTRTNSHIFQFNLGFLFRYVYEPGFA